MKEKMRETPKYVLIANRLRQEIAEGTYAPGDQLPQEMAIANDFNVSRITVRNALQQLENDGLIYRIQGAGTFVKDSEANSTSQLDYDDFEIIDFDRDQVKLLDFRVAKPTKDLQDSLELTKFDLCYQIKRAIYYHDELIGIQKLAMPVKVVQGLGMDALTQSIYPVLENDQDFNISSAEREYTLVDANEELAKDLSCSIHDKLLMVEQKSYLATQQIFEYAQTYFKTDGFSIKRILRYKPTKANN